MREEIRKTNTGIDPQKENELLSRALTDKEAFSALYDHYYPRLYNYIVVRMGEPCIADDLVSEVFEKTFRRLSSYDLRRGRFSTWIFTIAKNAVIDEQRRRSKKRELPLETENLSELTQESPLTKIEEQDRRALLLFAIHTLDQRDQNLLALKFWGGLNNRQIAEMLMMNEKTVGVVLYRALKKLRKLLEENSRFA